MPNDRYIIKIWHVHITNYYSAFKKRGNLTHARVWMNLEDSMLTEILKKTHIVKLTETDIRMVVPRTEVMGGW